MNSFYLLIKHAVTIYHLASSWLASTVQARKTFPQNFNNKDMLYLNVSLVYTSKMNFDNKNMFYLYVSFCYILYTSKKGRDVVFLSMICVDSCL